MKFFRLIITATILSWGALSGHSMAKSFTSFRYGTDGLERIGTTIGLDSITHADGAIADTVFYFDLGGKPSRADIRNGVVEHIGYRIFRDNSRDVNIPPVFDFIERFALESDLPFENTNYTELAKISYTNMSEKDLKDFFTKELSVSVNTVNHVTYNIEWLGSDTTYSMSVPVSYELLRGTQLPENERRLFEELNSSDIAASHEPKELNKDMFEATWKTNCYILRGKRVFSEHLSADRYYESDTTSTQLAFKILDNESYPVESISNMLTGVDIPNNLTVNLRMIAYPMEERSITVPLTQLVAYFLSKGCDIFTGINSLSDTEATYTVICRNAPYGYVHSMKITFPVSAVGKKEGQATAKITPFIPLPKIYNLFSEQ